MNKLMATNLAQVKDVAHCFFGRQGGVSLKPWDSLNTCYHMGDVKEHVDENRARICATLSLKPNVLYTPMQVHGTKSIRITRKDNPEEILHVQADSIWTTEPNIAVGVQTADCVPVLFASDDGQVIGAIHAGWRGAVAQISIKTIESVGEVLGLLPSRFVVAIGPAIGFEAFEVGPEVIDALLAAGIPSSNIVKKGREDRFHLDLAGLVQKQLQDHGVERVEIIRRCTASNIDEYFSYRGNKGRRGDQLSVITKAG